MREYIKYDDCDDEIAKDTKTHNFCSLSQALFFVFVVVVVFRSLFCFCLRDVYDVCVIHNIQNIWATNNAIWCCFSAHGHVNKFILVLFNNNNNNIAISINNFINKIAMKRSTFCQRETEIMYNINVHAYACK